MDICEKNLCTGCTACALICPVNAITMVESSEGFLYPEVDEAKCIKCNKCVRTCPNNHATETSKASFYMGWHKNLEVLKNSSSGGAFTALADWTLSQNGTVYGAGFDANTRKVFHVPIRKKEELFKIRLSKYYQSDVGQSYAEVKQDLKNGLVLFSGTACQIAGLYAYLGKKYDNLITVDVLCHGVASKKTVDAYIDSCEEEYHKKIANFTFRCKADNSYWGKGQSTRMTLHFEDGTSKTDPAQLDTYFLGFNQFLFLRNSCYHCKYVGTERIADFTIADYWGVPSEEIDQQHFQYGTSLILVNTPKAHSMLPMLSEEMFFKPIPADLAIANNQSLVKPATVNNQRETFFEQIEQVSFNKLIRKLYRKYYIKQYIKIFAVRLLGEKSYKIILEMKKGNRKK